MRLKLLQTIALLAHGLANVQAVYMMLRHVAVLNLLASKVCSDTQKSLVRQYPTKFVSGNALGTVILLMVYL